MNKFPALPQIRDENNNLETDNNSSVVPYRESKMNQQQIEQYETLVKIYETIHSEISNLEFAFSSLYKKIEYKQKQHSQIKNLQVDRVSQCGVKMVKLVQMICKNQGMFLKIPKGPLGTLISVRMPSWIPMVEHILLPYLFIFIVDNRKDYEVLVNFIDVIYGKHIRDEWSSLEDRKPDIWISKFTDKRKDVSKSRIPFGLGYTTLMDMLEIRDPAVFNVLREFTYFEKTILFNNEQDAFTKMAEPFRIPKNCKMGYTKDFLKVSPYPRFRTSSLYFEVINRDRCYKIDGSSSLATKSVLNERIRICQQGSKLVAKACPWCWSTRISNTCFHGSLFPSLEHLHGLQSHYYMLPSLTGITKSLCKEIQVMETERDFVKVLLKQKRQIRLHLLSRIESISEWAKN